MEDDSLVLKGLTGSVMLIGATLITVPGGTATNSYGIQETKGLKDLEQAETDSAEPSIENPCIKEELLLQPESTDLDDLEILNLQRKDCETVQVTEGIRINDYQVELTDTDGENAAYLTVREKGEIRHDQAYSEGEQLSYRDLEVQIENIDQEKESAQLEASVSDGYVIHGSTTVNELVEKLEKVNPRLDTSPLKNSNYNALIITGEDTEKAVKNLASLQEGVEKSQIDIKTS